MYLNKKICAIIPVYNEQKNIKNVINELPDYFDQIIVIDDKSTDSTVSIIEQIQKSRDEITLIKKNVRGGAGSAKKEGYLSARKTDNDIFVTLEARRKEWDDQVKELHSRISTNIRELREHQIQSESKVLGEIRSMREQLDNRVAVLEKWRWIIVGGSIFVGLMLSNPDSMLFKILG